MAAGFEEYIVIVHDFDEGFVVEVIFVMVVAVLTMVAE